MILKTTVCNRDYTENVTFNANAYWVSITKTFPPAAVENKIVLFKREPDMPEWLDEKHEKLILALDALEQAIREVAFNDTPKYGVFENGKPASSAGYPELCGYGWKNHIFDNFHDALCYLEKWLGDYRGAIPSIFTCGEKLDYNGYGDMVEIRRM